MLVLTKALGTGVVANALRADAAPADVLAAAVASMTTLNREARPRPARDAGEPHAVTDVTGFGLVGHLHELAEASGLAARLRLRRPAAPAGRARPGARRARAGRLAPQPRGGRCLRDFADGHDPLLAALACDAQTSGGLLAALAPGAVPAGVTVIGHLEQGDSGRVLVD